MALTAPFTKPISRVIRGCRTLINWATMGELEVIPLPFVGAVRVIQM